MPKFAIIDVKAIHSEVSRSDFSESDIERLADAILANGGLLQPLILKQTSVESFLVVEGHFEFYGAVRAREKNPRQGEMVNAFVISSSEEQMSLGQIQLLRKLPAASPSMTSSETVSDSSDLAPWITSFETRLSEMRETIFQNQQKSESRLKQLEKNLNASTKNLLETVNTLSGDLLTKTLVRCGLSLRQAESVTLAKANRPNQKFTSYGEIIKTTSGLGAAGLVKCIDLWESQQ